ncbi:MAG: M1 family aminopeptidase [Bacteroidales bacterium]|jgi:aminopeptidase N
MKYTLTIIMLFLTLFAFSQYHRNNSHGFDHPTYLSELETEILLTNDSTIDVKFYHLDIEIALDSSYLTGNVNFLITSQINGLNSLKLDLDSAFTIDSVSFPALSYYFSDNVLDIALSSSYDQGESFSFSVYYHGSPVMAGGYKGLVYNSHDGNELVIASLSTPYLAHTWWPCKDGTEDKADSIYVDITIKDTLIAAVPVIAVSNGVMDTVITIGGKKIFKWKHFYPIVPYYVMVAISNYQQFQQVFTGSGYSFPIDYYVFESHMAMAQIGVAELPDVMDFFTSIFGPYPFLQEKYAMTQLGFYGAIENQTNTITNNMGLSWFDVSIHELAHQWFADMITCQTWNHGWLNEGFASYAEALYFEHRDSTYDSYMTQFEYYSSGSVYLEDVSDPFNVFQPIIYEKGAYVLHMLRGVLGDETFFNVINNYVDNEVFRYKNATTEDFQLICENSSGQDLQYFFDQWIYDEYFPIYNWNYLFDQSTGNLEVVINQTQGILGRRDLFIMPMDIKIEFTDGTDTLVQIFNDTTFYYCAYYLNKEVNNIELDPNHWILKKTYFDLDIVVGKHELTRELFEVYPNPNDGTFNLKFSQCNSSSIFPVSVSDLSGDILYETIIKCNQDGNYVIELGNHKPGIYILNLKTDQEYYHKKIVVL